MVANISSTFATIRRCSARGGSGKGPLRPSAVPRRGIAAHLKTLAVKYKIDPAVVYPHSFRHRFAKSFLERCGDIALLADLMGHESIETTRIYLRRTSTEQRAVVDEVVTW